MVSSKAPPSFFKEGFNFMDKINAFILAAGEGERLRPITNHIPKPLIPVLGKPALQRILERVSALSVNKIGINLHYQRDVISKWIESSDFSDKIMIFPEEDVLGTGGALKNAEELLVGGTFLLHNSDIISDINLEGLIRQHLSSDNLATLAVHDHSEFNNVFVDEEGLLKAVVSSDSPVQKEGRRLAYTGISVYEPGFLKLMPEGPSSLVDCWLDAVKKGYKVGTFEVSGSSWNDIGTPAGYAHVLFEMLKSKGEMIYLHPSVKGCGDIEIDGYVVIENSATLGRRAVLKNTILLPGGRAEDDSEYKNYILGQDFKIDLSGPEIPGVSFEDDRLLIGTGGSDRRYYRLKRDEGTAVLMECPDDETDFERHIEYSRFFLKHFIPVPELQETLTEKKEAIFEDLGDTSLYNWLKCKRDEGHIETIYKKILDILVLIHTEATDNVSDCPALESRIFDYDHFRWETEYFIKRFIKGIKKMKVNDESVLDREFYDLAVKSASFPKTVIHRDFQSQNIMVTKGVLPRIIDFQGAKMGPPAYDIASILWDPYYRLNDELRERLLKYYIDKTNEGTDFRFRTNDFTKSLPCCRLQRHMQALGAYGFLSSLKRKKYFLKYVPEAVRLLKEDIITAKDKFPELYILINRL